MVIVGEAGVGKSRLVYEVIHSYRTQGWLVLESASVSYGKAIPYLPVLDLLKRYRQVEDRDGTRAIRARVTGQVLPLNEALQETIPAFLWLLETLPTEHPSSRGQCLRPLVHPGGARGFRAGADGAAPSR